MIERECPVCHNTYLANPDRLKWGRQTTCSRTCSYQLRAEKLQNKTRLVCGVCGREFERAASSVKGKYGAQFCSPACHYAGRRSGISQRTVTRPYTISDAGREAWRKGGVKAAKTRRQRDNYVKSDATRAKLSVATARALAKGKPYIVSKLEHKVAAQLDRLGVAYIAQHFFRDPGGRFAAVVDFYFPDLGAVLEVNGTYWHADPRVYPTPINEMQERCIARYRRKVDALVALGFRVVEVWEEDLKRNEAQAVLEAHAQLIRS